MRTGPIIFLKVYGQSSYPLEKIVENVKEEFSFSSVEVLDTAERYSISGLSDFEQQESKEFFNIVENNIEKEGMNLSKNLGLIGDRLVIFLFSDELFHFCLERASEMAEYDIFEHPYSSYPSQNCAPERKLLKESYKDYYWVYSPFVSLCAPKTNMLPQENIEGAINHELNHTFNSATLEWRKLQIESLTPEESNKYLQDTLGFKDPFYHESCTDENNCVGICRYFMEHSWKNLGEKCKSSIMNYQQKVGNKPLKENVYRETV